MSDSPWEALDGGTQDAWEDQYQDPDGGFSQPHRRDESSDTEDDGTTVTTIVDTYSMEVNLEGRDYSASLVHKCNKCNGEHVDSLRALEGFTVDVPYTPLHVGADKFGQGEGTLFSSVKVTGHLLRRVETRTRGAQNAAPQVTIAWERKDLDHVEQRDLVVLEEFGSVVDCVLGVEESSIGFVVPETEMFALALARVPILADDVGWSDDGRVIPDLAEALEGVERPIFRFTGGIGEAEMVLERRTGKETVEVGRVTLDVSRDGKRVAAKRYTPATE